MTEMSIAQYVNQDIVVQNIQQVMKDRTPDFIASIVSLTNANEKLKSADKKSLLGACLTAAALKLAINPNLGFAYIIPYDRTIKDKNGKIVGKEIVAQFQMGYKGFVQLAMRSGQFQKINVTEVREGEVRGIDRLSGDIDFVWHLDQDREKLKVIGYVAYFRLNNGFVKSLYMTVEELNKHGMRFSQTMKQGFGLWKTDFDSMARKTVLKQLLSKFAPMDTDMEKATTLDQAMISDGKVEYPDNQQLSAEDEANLKEIERIRTHIKKATTVKELQDCEEAIQDLGTQDDVQMWVDKMKEIKSKLGVQ